MLRNMSAQHTCDTSYIREVIGSKSTEVLSGTYQELRESRNHCLIFFLSTQNNDLQRHQASILYLTRQMQLNEKPGDEDILNYLII